MPAEPALPFEQDAAALESIVAVSSESNKRRILPRTHRPLLNWRGSAGGADAVAAGTAERAASAKRLRTSRSTNYGNVGAAPWIAASGIQ